MAVKSEQSDAPFVKTEGLFRNNGGKHLVTFDDARTYFSGPEQLIPKEHMDIQIYGGPRY